MGKMRIETDAMGEVAVPAENLWGAQTERCRLNFTIGRERFQWPRSVIRAFGIVKQSAALANAELGTLDSSKVGLIVQAAEEVISGARDTEFPLPIFQTGSGTQSNMNANEVIANLANQLAGGQLGAKKPIHPNDDVNCSQSSNDVFPTVMHLAIVDQLNSILFPALTELKQTLDSKSKEFETVTMIGRTHLQDATPVTLGQVISGWVTQIDQSLQFLRQSEQGLYDLALGGTAVGTGLNADPQFGAVAARIIASIANAPFQSAKNKYAALSAHDAVVNVSASLRTLAGALMKIANDIRWYASGPRAGIGELLIPENEPGSSIMPGKVNPTQCEALTMVAVQVYGNDHAVAFAGSQGNFQLNVFKPVMLFNTLESIELLAAGATSFHVHCVQGLEPNYSRISEHLEQSLMLVTALNPHIGYEKSAKIAQAAHRDNLTLREAAIRSQYVSPEDFDRWVRPAEMT